MNRRCLFLPGILMLFISAAFTADYEISADTQNLLTKLLSDSEEVNLKTQKIEITREGFLRLRRTYRSGKAEYFSLHLSRFKDLNYLGTEEHGFADVLAADSNIIVQTFNDPDGNVDSMATMLRLPLKQCSAEELSRLHLQFEQLRDMQKPVR